MDEDLKNYSLMILMHLSQMLPRNVQRIAHTSLAIYSFLLIHCFLGIIRGPNSMVNHQICLRIIYNYSIILPEDHCLQTTLPDKIYQIVLHTHDDGITKKLLQEQKLEYRSIVHKKRHTCLYCHVQKIGVLILKHSFLNTRVIY